MKLSLLSKTVLLLVALVAIVIGCSTSSEMECHKYTGEDRESCLSNVRDYQKSLDTQDPSSPNYLQDRRDREIPERHQ